MSILVQFICKPCIDSIHGKCRGDTWCDCQHKIPK